MAADVKIATGTVSTAIRITDFNQAAGAAPLEGNDLRWLCNSNPAMGPVYDTNQDGYIALKGKRSLRSTAASATGDIMELEVLNGYFEYAVDANSIAVPFADSKNLGEATVIGQTSRGGSHGPTNDGRVKPDLSTKTSPSASPTSRFTLRSARADGSPGRGRLIQCQATTAPPPTIDAVTICTTKGAPACAAKAAAARPKASISR